MPQIKSLISKYPVPSGKGPNWMMFTDFTGPSFFELAATFKLWRELTPEEQREIEKQPTIAKRREKLLENGLRKRALHELRPADFHLEEWIPKVEARIKEVRESDPDLKATIEKAEKKIEELAKERPLAKMRARAPLLRRLAINLYLTSENPTPFPPSGSTPSLPPCPPGCRARSISTPRTRPVTGCP